MGVMTAGATGDDAGRGPAGEAFAVSAAGPVVGLLLVALGTDLVGVIDRDFIALEGGEGVEIGFEMAGGAVHDVSGGVFEFDFPMGGLFTLLFALELGEGFGVALHAGELVHGGGTAGDVEFGEGVEAFDLDAADEVEGGLGGGAAVGLLDGGFLDLGEDGVVAVGGATGEEGEEGEWG